MLVLLAAAFAGCFHQDRLQLPPNPRTHAIAGVVEDLVRPPEGGEHYRLENGQIVEMPSQKTTLLGGEPLVGELLLAGTDADGRQWVAGVSLGPPGRPDGCFWLPSQGRPVDGWIDTTAGFRLPKAAGFDPGYAPNNEFTSDRGGFCLNEAGEVTSYDVA